MLRSYNMLKELAHDNDVTLIAPVRRDVLQGMYANIEEGVHESERELAKFCSRIHLVEAGIGESKIRKLSVALGALLSGSAYSIDWLKSKALKDKVDSVLREGSFDLIHVDTVSMMDYLDDRVKALVAINHHNIESDMMRVRSEKSSSLMARTYLRIEANRIESYEKLHCRRAWLNLTCSEEDAKRLKELDSALSVEVVPNGVDVDYFRPDGTEPRPCSMIFVGGQSWYPNKDAMEFFADEIWPLLKAARDDIEFDLIGKNPSKKILELAQSDERFRVHGFVDDIRPMVARAAVYVCPIRDGGGTKLKILDALSCGKAIVAYPHAVDGIEVKDKVSVLLARTPDEFASKCLSLFDDARLRDRIGVAARSLAVEKYSYRMIGKALRERYACR